MQKYPNHMLGNILEEIHKKLFKEARSSKDILNCLVNMAMSSYAKMPPNKEAIEKIFNIIDPIYQEKLKEVNQYLKSKKTMV